MATRITVEETEKLQAQKPSMKATFLGLIMGIGLALIAQLFLKPLEVRQEHAGNFTIYLGNQPIANYSPSAQFIMVFLLFGVACVVYWTRQMQTIGLRGRTHEEVQHGIVKEDLEDFVAELDKSLEKGERYGYEIKKYPSEAGAFSRGVRLSGEEEDSVSLKIRPFIAVVESEKDLLSLGAAKRVIESLSFSSLRTKYKHITMRYFERGATPLNPSGPRLVVNQRTRRAFWVTSELDDLARQGVIECYSHPDEEYHEWARKENLELFDRYPNKEELLS